MRVLFCSLFCLLNLSVFVRSYEPFRYLHDYVRDGRPDDGPFPSSLKNIPYYCYQAPSKGPCAHVYKVWFFDVVRRKCMPMFYSGCGGNANRFSSIHSCEIHCDHSRIN